MECQQLKVIWKPSEGKFPQFQEDYTSVTKIFKILIYRATDINITSPYVNSMLVDYNYMGYCASISFESLKSYMIKIGDLNQNAIDSGFIAMIFLKVANLIQLACLIN